MINMINEYHNYLQMLIHVTKPEKGQKNYKQVVLDLSLFLNIAINMHHGLETKVLSFREFLMSLHPLYQTKMFS